MIVDLSLALRNLVRNRRRSLATALALAIGAAAILLFGGYRANIQYSLNTAYVREGGHLQIQHRDFFLYGNGNPTAYGIARYQHLIDAIRRDDALRGMVTVVTPMLQFGGIASNYGAAVSRTVIGAGVVAADRNRMRAWNEFSLPIVPPHFALEGASADAAMVGVGVARVLQLCEPLGVPDCPKPVESTTSGEEALPDDIALLAQREALPASDTAAADGPRLELLASSAAGGAPNVVSLNIVRAERQPFKELDEVFIVLQLPQAQRLVYGRSEPQATSIAVQLERSSQLPEAKARLEALLLAEAPDQPLAVLDFRELNEFFVQTTELFDTLFGFVFVLIAAIVLFTVGNTMNTAVMERTVEIGTVRAMGLRQRGVRRLFVLEGTLLGVAGAVSGALFAIAASAVVNRIGLTWLPPGSGDRLPLVLLVWGETTMIVGTTLGLILVATLSAWWPAYRASRLPVVEALRHV
jgi:putative ABC transport system permease protein